MGIIEILNKYSFLVKRIHEIQEQIAEIEDKKKNLENTLKATQITDMPKNPNITDMVSEIAVKLVQYTNQITRLRDEELELTLQKMKVDNFLNDLEPDKAVIVKLRHFERKDFRQIASEVFLSKSRVWEKYQEAIKELENRTKTGQEIGKNGQIWGKHVV
jgi:RNA polymerase sigma factor (sigma-70 family)